MIQNDTNKMPRLNKRKKKKTPTIATNVEETQNSREESLTHFDFSRNSNCSHTLTALVNGR